MSILSDLGSTIGTKLKELTTLVNTKLDKTGTATNSNSLSGVGIGGFGRFQNNITLNGSTNTADLITELTNEYGAFGNTARAYKVGWSYAGNTDLTDTGFGTFELAGCLIETFGETYKHMRITRPTTGAGGGQILVYNDQGVDYLPGWRQIWTSKTDGSGSGLDADKLDGLDSTQFLRSDANDSSSGRVALLGNHGLVTNFSEVAAQSSLRLNGDTISGSAELSIYKSFAPAGASGIQVANGTATGYYELKLNEFGGDVTVNNNKVLTTASIIDTSSINGLDTITKNSNTTGTEDSTLLTLDNYVGVDLSQQKSFIDFKLRDDNENYTPQVRIGAEVGMNDVAGTLATEGSGAFVVYTSVGNEDGINGVSTEKLRVDAFGDTTIQGDIYSKSNKVLTEANRTISTATPSGGAHGDVWYQV